MNLIASLFRRERTDESVEDPRRVEMVQRVLRMSPRLRYTPNYWTRLEEAVDHGVGFVLQLAASLPQAREASSETWRSDAQVRAFFRGPGDIASLVHQTTEMRALLLKDPSLQDAYAILGAAYSGPLNAEMVPRVGSSDEAPASSKVSLNDQKLRICADDPATLRSEIVRSMVDQLLLETLAHIASDRSRHGILERERTLLKSRLRLLERQGVGLRALIGGENSRTVDSNSLVTQLEQNSRELESLGPRKELLEHELDAVCAVFADPSPLLTMAPVRLWLDSSGNLTVGEREGEAVDLHLARNPGDPPQMRVLLPVRLPRGELVANA